MKTSLFLLVIIIQLIVYNMSMADIILKYPISEIQVQHVLVTNKYVVCGTDAYWGAGSNIFGLFIFNRETEAWTNHCIGNGIPSNSVKFIRKKNDLVEAGIGYSHFFYFNPTNENYTIKSLKGPSREYLREEYNIKYKDKLYQIKKDTIHVHKSENEILQYSPHNLNRSTKYSSYNFTHPTIINGKIYFVINDGFPSFSKGIGCFDLANNSFDLYESDIFKGSVTDYIVLGSSLIYSTAAIMHEGNPRPANGFIEFSTKNKSFNTWNELNLPQMPLAIFKIEEDSKEYWIGTNVGLFRINKDNRTIQNYIIKSGLVTREGANVHSYRSNNYPLIADLHKGDRVELVSVLAGWFEIKSPVNYRGFISSSFVIPQNDRYLEIRPFNEKELRGLSNIEIKSQSNKSSNNLLIFNFQNKPLKKYRIQGVKAHKDSIQFYGIGIPTAWIHTKDIKFEMKEYEAK